MTLDPAITDTNSAVRPFQVDVGEEAIATFSNGSRRGGTRARACRRSVTRRATRDGAKPRRLFG